MTPTLELIVFLPLSSLTLAWVVCAFRERTYKPSWRRLIFGTGAVLFFTSTLTLLWPTGSAKQVAPFIPAGLAIIGVILFTVSLIRELHIDTTKHHG